MRIQAALMGIHTEAGGNMTETITLAKLTAAIGAINEEVGGNKSTKTLGQITFVKGDESEKSAGAMTTMVGGAVLDKIAGGYTIEAGGPATFIGAFHKLEAKTKITFTCGASTVTIDGSGVSVSSPIVAVLAGKIVLTKAVSEV
jgi:type VI secretion system secreted protein VgrG